MKISERSLLLPILAVIVLVVMAGEAMLTAALPTISNDFDVPGVFESWVLPMVLLVGAAAAPFIGTAGDRYGRRRLLLICLIIYLIGLFSGYIAQNIWILLISRALQGVGIASFPLAYAMIRDQLPNRDADVGIGVISAMYGAGMFIGVIIGSFIIEIYSWRMTYLPLIPITVVLILLTVRCIHESRPYLPSSLSSASKGCSVSGLDWAGLITLFTTLLLGLVALSLEGSSPSDSGFGMRILLGCCAFVSGALFVWIELRSPCPIIDVHLVMRRPVLLLIGIGTLTVLAFLMFLQEMPFFIQSKTGLGLTAASVGLILMPGTLCDMLAGPLTGRLVVSRGVRPACIIGSLLLISSISLMILGEPSFLLLVCVWMVFSAGMSATATACLIAIIDYVPRTRTAEATGLMQCVQTIGGMAGPVVTGIVLASSTVSDISNGKTWWIPAAETFTQVHMILLFLSIVVLLCSLALRSGVVENEMIKPESV
jgi:MFS family permease